MSLQNVIQTGRCQNVCIALCNKAKLLVKDVTKFKNTANVGVSFIHVPCSSE